MSQTDICRHIWQKEESDLQDVNQHILENKLKFQGVFGLMLQMNKEPSVTKETIHSIFENIIKTFSIYPRILHNKPCIQVISSAGGAIHRCPQLQWKETQRNKGSKCSRELYEHFHNFFGNYLAFVLHKTMQNIQVSLTCRPRETLLSSSFIQIQKATGGDVTNSAIIKHAGTCCVFVSLHFKLTFKVKWVNKMISKWRQGYKNNFISAGLLGVGGYKNQTSVDKKTTWSHNVLVLHHRTVMIDCSTATLPNWVWSVIWLLTGGTIWGKVKSAQNWQSRSYKYIWNEQ